MLRKRNEQTDFMQGWLPTTMTTLRPELAYIDKLLDDEEFFEPFEKIFSPHMGRPSIPIETYLRMMYLKFSRQLGYEVLTAWVEDSIQYRIFCRIALNDPAPDPSTLEKLTVRIGEHTIEEINQRLGQKLKAEEKITGKKLRVDTTVVDAKIHYPTDTTLLGDCIRVIRRGMHKLKKLGAKITFRDRWRSAKKVLQNVGRMGSKAGGDGKERMKKVLKKMVGITQATATDAHESVKRLKQSCRKKCRTVFKRVIETVTETIQVTEKIMEQTRKVIAGNTQIPNRIVSIFDQNARPIVRGKADKPVEFGYKLLLEENNGFFIGYRLYQGNPADAGMIEEIKRLFNQIFRGAPKEMSTDCGFSSSDNERALMDWGVEHLCMPPRGKRSQARKQIEQQSWYRRVRKYHAGIEGKNSVYKRVFGGDCSLFPGYDGSRRWVGWGIFSHNLRYAANTG